MKTYANYDHLSLSSSSKEIVHVHAIEKKNHFIFSDIFFRKSCRLWDNVEKYGRIGHVKDVNIKKRMRFACWVNKATDTHTHTHNM